MDNTSIQPAPRCHPAPTSPAAAAAMRRGQVAVEVYETRRARLRLLIEERAGGSQRKFAGLFEYTRSNIHHFLSTTYNHGRSMGERAARKLEHKAGLPYGWLDQAVASDQSETRPGCSSRDVGDLDVEAEQAKFEQFWRPHVPRAQFTLNADGEFTHKAMRDRLAGWLTARSLDQPNDAAIRASLPADDLHQTQAEIGWKMANWLFGLSVSELLPESWRSTCAELSEAWHKQAGLTVEQRS